MKKQFDRWILAILMALTGVVLGGCTKETKLESSDWEIPVELKDCQIFRMQNENGQYMRVMRCPSSVTSTSYKSGKTTQTAVVIDGVTYAPVAASSP